MTSLAVYAVFVLIITSGVAWVAYLTGRDTAERDAFHTISTLRADLRSSRLETQRAMEKGTRYRHPAGKAWNPETDAFDPRQSTRLGDS
jgi:hypothetical protein